MFQLRPDQARDAHAIATAPHRGAVVATDVGGGKTATAVAAAVKFLLNQQETFPPSKAIVLIIAPTGTHDGWERHIRLLDPATATPDAPVPSFARPVHRIGVGKAGKAGFDALTQLRPGWYITGWEYARRYSFEKIPVAVLIGDEVHRQQNRKSANHELFSSTAHAVYHRGGLTISLSATPYGNKAEGAFALCHSTWGANEEISGKLLSTNLGRHRYDFFWPFVEEYIGTEFNQFAGAKQARRFEREPGKIAAEMPLFIRHAQGYQCCEFHPKGLQADLPRRQVTTVTVPLNPVQKRLFDEMYQDMMAWVEDSDWPIQGKGYPIVQSTRLRQISLATPTTRMVPSTDEDGNPTETLEVTFALDARSSKLDKLVEIFTDLDAAGTGERLVVFTHSAAIIPVVVERLNTAAKKRIAAGWYGDVNAKQRQARKDWFIYGAHPDARKGTPVDAANTTYSPVAADAGLPRDQADVQVIVAQIGAIGEGVDGLQWVCHNEVWLSLEASAILNYQALGRLERDGQKYSVNSWNLVADTKIEKDQNYSLDNQRELMRKQLNYTDDH